MSENWWLVVDGWMGCRVGRRKRGRQEWGGGLGWRDESILTERLGELRVTLMWLVRVFSVVGLLFMDVFCVMSLCHS